MPISAKASHSAGSPKVPRNDCAGLGDHGDRIGREPDRRLLDRRPRVRVGERVLPHAALARELLGELGRRRPASTPRSASPRSPRCPPTAGPSRSFGRRGNQRSRARGRSRLRTGGIELLVVGDLARLVRSGRLSTRPLGLDFVAHLTPVPEFSARPRFRSHVSARAVGRTRCPDARNRPKLIDDPTAPATMMSRRSVLGGGAGMPARRLVSGTGAAQRRHRFRAHGARSRLGGHRRVRPEEPVRRRSRW